MIELSIEPVPKARLKLCIHEHKECNVDSAQLPPIISFLTKAQLLQPVQWKFCESGNPANGPFLASKV